MSAVKKKKKGEQIKNRDILSTQPSLDILAIALPQVFAEESV